MIGNEIVITFLGTGSAIPPEDRQQASLTLRHPKGLVIFDCGEGSQYSLRKYQISTRKEIVIVISHLHSDHFLGLPGMLSSFQLLGREDKITIIGPKLIERTVRALIQANFVYFEYPLEIIELTGGDEFRGGGYTIKAIDAEHEGKALSFIWVEDSYPGRVDIEKIKSFGIPSGPLIGDLQKGLDVEYEGKLIKSSDVVGKTRSGRVIVYSGDTAYNERLITSIPANCNLLIHEGTYPGDLQELANERKHSTVIDAANIAKNAKVDFLIITHISPRILDLNYHLGQAKKIFPNVRFAKEGETFVIPY